MNSNVKGAARRLTAAVCILLALLPMCSRCQSSVPCLDRYPNDTEVNSNTTSLNFALMMSFSDAGFNSNGLVPGVQVALDQINNNSSILADYTLRYSLTDSEVYTCTVDGEDQFFCERPH